MHKILNLVRREVERVLSHRASTRYGIVTSVDPVRYCARVRLQPENVETGWLPISTEWVGNGWGMTCPPSPGDVVKLSFQEGDKQAPMIDGRYYSSVTQSPGGVSGELWLVHKTGSLLKLLNDGSISISANTNLTVAAPNGTLRLTGKIVQVHATQEYRFDTNGHGQVWFATKVDTYQTGETPGATNPITPPEIPE